MSLSLHFNDFTLCYKDVDQLRDALHQEVMTRELFQDKVVSALQLPDTPH